MGRKILHHLLLTTALILTVVSSAYAQDEETKLNPIQWSFNPPQLTAPVKPGDQFTVELTAKIERGWHLYSTTPIEGGPKPTRITLMAGQGFAIAGQIETPDPLVEKDPNFGIETEFYEEKVTFKIPVQVSAEATAGKQTLIVQVRYQTCSKQLCLPPKLLKFEAPIEVAAHK